MAKAMATDAADACGRAALQCHGAIGYTVEHDLHLYLKRSWALARAWGDRRVHAERVGQALAASLDPAESPSHLEVRSRCLRLTSSTPSARPVGKRNGGLAGIHPADLGAHALNALVERTGIDPGAVEDVVFGCLDTIGPQAGDIARTAGWPRACPSTCRARPSTASAARRSRPCTSPPRRSCRAPPTWSWPAACRTCRPIPISSAMTRRRAARLHRPVLGLGGLGQALRRPGGQPVPRAPT